MKCSVCNNRKLKLTKTKTNLICSKCLEDFSTQDTDSESKVDRLDSPTNSRRMKIKEEPDSEQHGDQLFQSVLCDGSEENLDEVNLQIKDEITISETQVMIQEEKLEENHPKFKTQNTDESDAYNETTQIDESKEIQTNAEINQLLQPPSLKIKDEPQDFDTDVDEEMMENNSHGERYQEDDRNLSQEIQIKDEITIEETKLMTDDEQVAAKPKQQKLSCNFCDFTTTFKRTFTTHRIKNHPEDRNIRCQICHFQFTGETLYRKHIQEKHNGFENMCQICLKLFHGKVAEHNGQCLGRLLFNCNYCDMSYGKKESLWRHLDDHSIKEKCKEASLSEMRTKERFYSCVHCEDDRIYLNVPYWKHLREFHQGHPFRCDYCKSTFMRAKTLKNHMDTCKSDTAEGVVKCPNCLKTFQNEDNLKKHTKVAHKEFKYSCQYCSKGFRSPNGLYFHVQAHRNERAYHCNLCVLAFNTATALARHNRTYHDERNTKKPVKAKANVKHKYECKVCAKTFQRFQNLEVHMDLHQQNKSNYSCDECIISFISKSALEKHLKTSIAHVEVNCKECRIVFANASKFDLHIHNRTCKTFDEHQQAVGSNQKNKVEPDGGLNKSSQRSKVRRAKSKEKSRPEMSDQKELIQERLSEVDDAMQLGGQEESMNLAIQTSKTDQCDTDENMVLSDECLHEDSNVNQDEAIQIKTKFAIKESSGDESTTDEHSGKTYRCKYCNFSSNQDSEYRSHIKKNHSESRTIRCQICVVMIKGEPQYRQHIQDKHQGFDRKCPVCLAEYTEAEKNHKSQCVGRLIFSCKLCNISYVTKQSLWKHLDDHNVQDEHKNSSLDEHTIKTLFNCCVICGDEKIHHRADYWKHIKDVHQGNHLQCEHCKKTFKKAFNRTSHMISCKVAAIADGSLNCLDCQKNFSDEESMKLHKKLVHNTPNFHCQYCPRKFHHKNSFRRHQKYHESSRKLTSKFTCSLCSFDFYTPAGLASHTRSSHKCDEESRNDPA